MKILITIHPDIDNLEQARILERVAEMSNELFSDMDYEEDEYSVEKVID